MIRNRERIAPLTQGAIRLSGLDSFHHDRVTTEGKKVP